LHGFFSLSKRKITLNTQSGVGLMTE